MPSTKRSNSLNACHPFQEVLWGHGAETEIYSAADEICVHRSYLRRIVTLVTNYRLTFAGILAASLLLNLFGLAAPRFTQIILDRAVPHGDLRLLTYLVLGMVLFTALQITLTIWRRFTLVHLNLKFDRILLRAFGAHLLALPAQFFKTRQAGDLVSRLNEHGLVRHLFAGGLTRAAI